MDEGGFLFIVDGIKDMIVTGGENVYSKEVEDRIMEHPAIAEAAVIGENHEIQTQRGAFTCLNIF